MRAASLRPAALPCGSNVAAPRKPQSWQPIERSSSVAPGVGPSGRAAAGVCRAAHSESMPMNNIVELDEYRRGVGLCLVNPQGLVFAARRMDDSENTWQMPQGGIDPYENPMTAALRELHEETGITNCRILASIDTWLHYTFPTRVRAQFAGSWLRYKGQTQKWFLIEFSGSEEEIDLSCNGHPEFSEYRWMPLEELPENVVGFKREVYSHVARHFTPRIASLRGKACAGTRR